MKELAFLEKREIVKAYCEQKSSLFQNAEPRVVEMDEWMFDVTTYLGSRPLW